MRTTWLTRMLSVLVSAAFLLAAAACANQAPAALPTAATATNVATTPLPTQPVPISTAAESPTTASSGASAVAAQPAPTTESTPFPYTTPLPELVETPLDVLYTKIDSRQGTPVPCVRCPDYRPMGGEWVLRFDKGIFRVYHPGAHWRTVGSYTIDGDHITLFNDPTCHTQVGSYIWKLDGETLTFQVVDDSCAIGLRAKALTVQPWSRTSP
jgi:hypothetical protein